MLTSDVINYRFSDIEFEYELAPEISADLYIKKENLAIQVDGPTHYWNNTNERRPKLLERRIKHFGCRVLHLDLTLYAECRLPGEFHNWKLEDVDKISHTLLAQINNCK